ncbi:MAG: esterase-like activity of phytase family protein [bacterium]|nr:esterase-like activity of phytase family protein [bacterium]
MPRRLVRHAALRGGLLLCAMLAGGCGNDRAPSTGQPLARLDARVVLPADTFDGEGPVGAALDTTVNGRTLPLASVPVQGFSSLIAQGNELLALQDNGLGTLANSADFPLRWYRLQPDWANGTVTVMGTVELRDPDHLLPFALGGTGHLRRERRLSGADLDPEAMVAMDDGTFWLADEFGPSLVHVGADGVVLDKPAHVAVPAALRVFARGSPYLRTPDHPDFRDLRDDASRRDLANLPRSGGIEGLARSNDGTLLYAAIEKGMLDDTDAARRVILEFDPVRRNATGRAWFYRATAAGVSLSSLEADGTGGLLVLERDATEGRQAAIKRIYRVVPGRTEADGFLAKTLVCDLLSITDDRGLTRRQRGTLGLGERFSLPHVTPECLLVLDASTLVVAVDNNYPFSAGRRAGKPDDNEIVRLRLDVPLHEAGAAVAAAPADRTSR